MVLIEDTRQKVGEHDNIKEYCEANDITILREPLKVGDYMLPNGSISVDTKQDVLELASDLYEDSKKYYKKYRKCFAEKIKLVILVEENVKDISYLQFWKSKYTKITGRQVMKMITDIRFQYGVEVRFCERDRTGETIIAILGGF